MRTGRLEAFSDGVLAIIITIMVLEMKEPHGTGAAALRPVVPVFLSYVLSFLYIGIYWNNHHHMLHATKRVTGGVLWANLHLLFWLSLIPFTTGWLGGSWLEEQRLASLPTALYGSVLLFAAVAYTILQVVLIRAQAEDSALRSAVGRDVKGKASLAAYAAAVALAFVLPTISVVIYLAVALAWLVPDRRIESRVRA